jgi:hypothetical protein
MRLPFGEILARFREPIDSRRPLGELSRRSLVNRKYERRIR